MSNPPLSPEIKQAFDRDGFVYLPGFLDAAQAAELRARLERYVSEVVPNIPAADKFYENKAETTTLKQLMRMDEHDPYFRELISGGRFLELATLLLGGPVVSRGVEFFNKPPQVGMPTPPHQDGYYFMIEPNEAATFWIAIDEVDAENGCLRYVRGSHRRGIRPHSRTQTLGFSQGIVDYGKPEDVDNELAFNAHPGDVLVHHSLTIHRADGNKSANRTRRAVGFVYYSAEAKIDMEARKAYQERLERELAETGKI